MSAAKTQPEESNEVDFAESVSSKVILEADEKESVTADIANELRIITHRDTNGKQSRRE